MAKQSKSGLGRGLNSLLSGSMGEAIPQEDAVKERETVSFDDVPKEKKEEPQRKPSERPVRVSTPLAKEASRETVSKPIEKHADTSKEAEPAPKKAYDENDNVTIKEVVQRDRKLDEVPVSAVEPNPDQPRTNFNKEELEELASSIQKDGLLQPILVRSVGEKYQIIAGERRWQACKTIGMSTIPVRVKEANDDQALELALIENIQRSDLNPIEEAYGYRRLMERQNLTQSEVAQAVSKGRSTVANALRLLELPEEAQQMLFEDKISAGHARAILSIPTKDGRQKLTDKMLDEKISVREAEMMARLLSGRKSADEGGAVRVPTPLVFKSVARELREAFDTNVKVKTVKGKNKIEIEFENEEELERLFAKMTAFSKEQ